MTNYVMPLVVGFIAGLVDIMPMIRLKLDRRSISSAFAFHLIMPVIVFNSTIILPWWFKGGLIYLICCVPILFLVGKDDRKSLPIIALTSTVIGTVVGFIFHFNFNWQ